MVFSVDASACRRPSLRPGIADPQGATIERSLLRTLGFDAIRGVGVGKSIRFRRSRPTSTRSHRPRRSRPGPPCERFLTNPVIEDVSIEPVGGHERGRVIRRRWRDERPGGPCGAVPRARNWPSCGTRSRPSTSLGRPRARSSGTATTGLARSRTWDDAVIVPGGFAHGDYLRPGAIARFSPSWERWSSWPNNAGAPVMSGICNGFQVLTEAGLLPGALQKNRGLKFLCAPRWKACEVRVEPELWSLTGAATRRHCRAPVAHQPLRGQLHLLTRGAGRPLRRPIGSCCATPTTPVADRWTTPSPGSCSTAERNVVGLMPHPGRRRPRPPAAAPASPTAGRHPEPASRLLQVACSTASPSGSSACELAKPGGAAQPSSSRLGAGDAGLHAGPASGTAHLPAQTRHSRCPLRSP